jgi:alkaline phosphatase D
VLRTALRVLVSLALVILPAIGFAKSAPPPARTVVVLLFDGWAPSLLEGVATPNLDRIRREGAWTHHMIPAFPTISLVNQVTISTGCWPEHHGIVSNSFHDPERGQYDHSHDADWLVGCEHLHQAAERQDVRSAALGWVGRTSSARGDLASAVSAEKKRDEFPDDGARVEQVIKMLRMPEPQRPRLILAYFNGPDGSAHFNGMDAWQTRQTVAASDAHVGKILAAINDLPFRDQTTVIVTTDHGMVPVTDNVNIKKILLNHNIDAAFLSAGTTSFLYFSDPTQVDRAFTELSGYAEFDVVRRTAQPSDWHLGQSPRVGDLIVSAKPPYFIEDIDRWPAWAQWLGTWGPEFIWARFALKATHGYPADTPGVEGILYAWGSGIAPGREVASLRAIDIHPTVARLLGIKPGVPCDGQVANDLLAAP